MSCGHLGAYKRKVKTGWPVSGDGSRWVCMDARSLDLTAVLLSSSSTAAADADGELAQG